MGNWNINIQGTGSHHNRKPDGERWNQSDADLMAEEFVKDLKAAGHNIETASFTHGSKMDLAPKSQPWSPETAPGTHGTVSANG